MEISEFQNFVAEDKSATIYFLNKDQKAARKGRPTSRQNIKY